MHIHFNEESGHCRGEQTSLRSEDETCIFECICTTYKDQECRQRVVPAFDEVRVKLVDAIAQQPPDPSVFRKLLSKPVGWVSALELGVLGRILLRISICVVEASAQPQGTY